MSVIERDFGKRLNAIANDSSVRPHIGIDGSDAVDLTPLLADPANVALMSDDGGVVFAAQEPGIYEGHVLFREGARGKYATQITKLAIWWMFTRSPMVELYMRVPENRNDVFGLVRQLGARQEWEHDGAKLFCQRLGDWIWKAEGLVESGREFNERFGGGESDERSLRALGFALDCIRGGELVKAFVIQQRIARNAQVAPLIALTERPLTVAWRDVCALFDGRDWAKVSENVDR